MLKVGSATNPPEGVWIWGGADIPRLIFTRKLRHGKTEQVVADSPVALNARSGLPLVLFS